MAQIGPLATLVVLSAVAGAAACTPSADPPWVLSRPRELGLSLHVSAQGPWGEPIDDGTLATEFLPGDRLKATPIFAGPDGAIAPEEIEIRWWLCDDETSCLLRADPGDAPACDAPPLSGPAAPCSLGTGATIEFEIGQPPLAPQDLPAGDAALAIATQLPVLALIASAPDGPGAAACTDSLGNRTSLQGCLLLERTIPLGPVSEVLTALEPLGYDIDVSEGLTPILQRPRNHSPRVSEFSVRWDGGEATVASGGVVTVPRGADVHLDWLPGPDDIESYEVTLDGEQQTLEEESVRGQWYVDRLVEGYAPQQQGRGLDWRAEEAEPATFHLLLRDDRGSETSGWLRVDVAG